MTGLNLGLKLEIQHDPDTDTYMGFGTILGVADVILLGSTIEEILGQIDPALEHLLDVLVSDSLPH